MERDRRNRRAAKRYGLDLHFEYRLFGRDGSVQEGWGQTLNMSSGGLLVASDQPICKGRTIEITVQMPAQFKDAPGPRLVVLGHVLRSEAMRAAIRILRHGFIHVSSQEPAGTRARLAVEAAGGEQLNLVDTTDLRIRAATSVPSGAGAVIGVETPNSCPGTPGGQGK